MPDSLLLELPYNISDTFKWFEIRQSTKPNPDLRAVIATKDLTVLNQSSFETLAGGTNGCTHPCNTAADYHKIE
ncbi:hypothetical protein SDC9_55185 [bioreactor metagenome]|uniref:Uncharacterized protein n=1 Tax=bioreactor metagenome TaxID=1076179 RepID=A0A644WYI3_9ZZZZ